MVDEEQAILRCVLISFRGLQKDICVLLINSDNKLILHSWEAHLLRLGVPALSQQAVQAAELNFLRAA